MAFQKAQRVRTPIRLSIESPTGGGKTMSALLLAYGMVRAKHPDWTNEQCWDRVYLIDTERGSGSLYSHLGAYNIDFINAPYEPIKFVNAIAEAERACNGDGVIVLDSATHEWNGDGGCLDMVSRLGGATAWKTVTPLHNRFVSALLQTRCDVVTCTRSKMDYVFETNDKGKTFPKKVGIGVEQRPGWEYEWTIVFSLDQASHYATATKDRTSLFDGRAPFMISAETGKEIVEWNNSGRPMTAEEFEAWKERALQAAGADTKNAFQSAPETREAGASAPHVPAVENVSSEAPAGKTDTKKRAPKEEKKSEEKKQPEATIDDPVKAIRHFFKSHFGENTDAMVAAFPVAAKKILDREIAKPSDLSKGQAQAMYLALKNNSYKLPAVNA